MANLIFISFRTQRYTSLYDLLHPICNNPDKTEFEILQEMRQSYLDSKLKNINQKTGENTIIGRYFRDNWPKFLNSCLKNEFINEDEHKYLKLESTK